MHETSLLWWSKGESLSILIVQLLLLIIYHILSYYYQIIWILIINEDVLSFHDLLHFLLRFLTFKIQHLYCLCFLNPYQRRDRIKLRTPIYCIRYCVYRILLYIPYRRIYNQFCQGLRQRKHNQELLFLQYPKIWIHSMLSILNLFWYKFFALLSQILLSKVVEFYQEKLLIQRDQMYGSLCQGKTTNVREELLRWCLFRILWIIHELGFGYHLTSIEDRIRSQVGLCLHFWTNFWHEDV